jgi:uncharacterized Zn finger protein
MDILTIATREANKVHQAAESREAYAQTLRRGCRAERIAEAGKVFKNGGVSSCYVESQSGNGRHHVDLDASTCECPDREHRASFCKHLIAAELFARNEEPGDPHDSRLGGLGPRRAGHDDGRQP